MNKKRLRKHAVTWAQQYQKLYSRLSWPLRLLLIAASLVLGAFALLVVYDLALMAFAFVIVSVFLGAIFGGRRRGGGGHHDQYMQDMFDAEQRQHEDEGRV